MILRGPVGRSGDEAEDDGPSERVGLGVRRSRPLLAIFFGRAIEVIKLKVTKDEHKSSKGVVEERKRNQPQTKSVGVDHDVSVSCQISFLGLTKPLNKKFAQNSPPSTNILRRALHHSLLNSPSAPAPLFLG